MKQRLDKFKAEQVGQYQKEIQEKTSEIEVLKEMIRASQVTIKAKEREAIRYKQRGVVNQEIIQQLAQKQINIFGTPAN